MKVLKWVAIGWLIVTLILTAGFLLGIYPPDGAPVQPTTTTTAYVAPTTTTTVTPRTTGGTITISGQEGNFLANLEVWGTTYGYEGFFRDATDSQKIELAHTICASLGMGSDILVARDSLIETSEGDHGSIGFINLAVAHLCPEYSDQLSLIGDGEKIQGCIFHPGRPHILDGLNHSHCADDFQTYGTGE